MEPVAVSQSMHQSSDNQLGFRVFRTYQAHLPASLDAANVVHGGNYRRDGGGMRRWNPTLTSETSVKMELTYFRDVRMGPPLVGMEHAFFGMG